MPFITSKISQKITKEQELELKKGLGKAIELVPGKSENVLFTLFEDDVHMYLRGDDSEPLAFIQVAIFGTENHVGYPQLTKQISTLFNRVLGIKADHMYIDYEDITSWGVQGQFVDRRQFY